ncbi:5-dehydro-4-deoxyglucarate dehydratase [Pseudoclavibacter terrae]|uniref:5-dehydro-4-deoxyglucarate dehydratase n=1 Tax=Pseudoclavibacter terrae TaxID=1530195 RepID=UPI00232FDF51|nr:5-dehydro-4-deoxyglucarate dehydratase [Pseudoclavibacter terrae]
MLDRILFFPVTPFTADDAVDVAALAQHLEQGLAHEPGGIFIACGTGEFHALSLDEYTTVVDTAVTTTKKATPVFAGAGGALADAKAQVRSAEAVGADGILLLPPYLVAGPSEGLVAYVEQVAGATTLPVIVYHRSTARFDEHTAVAVSRIPNVIGLKDGVGDIDLMSRIVRSVTDETQSRGEDFLFFNGLPTAEIAQEAYKAIGVPLYSSASFAFAPDIALAFFDAVESGDKERLAELNRSFYHPLVRLRNSVPGYAVSLVKEATKLAGINAGHVRAPLIDAKPEHVEELKKLIDDTRALLAKRAGTPAEQDRVAAPVA